MPSAPAAYKLSTKSAPAAGYHGIVLLFTSAPIDYYQIRAL